MEPASIHDQAPDPDGERDDAGDNREAPPIYGSNVEGVDADQQLKDPDVEARSRCRFAPRPTLRRVVP
jgi:hypothetical protein